MSEEKPKKIKRPRLRKPASQIQQALDDLDILMQDKSMKPAKLADLAIARLSCLQSLLLMQSDETKAKFKFADIDALLKENAELKAENAALKAETPTHAVESDSVARFKERLSQL